MTEIEAARDLIERARAKEDAAWTEIYNLFSAPIYSFLLHQSRQKETAEDLTAGVFIEALKGINRFEGDVTALRSWLFRIARNNLIDYKRRMKRAVLQDIDEANASDLERAAESIDPEAFALANLDRARLRAAVESLSPDQREVILLRLTGDLGSAEIAEMTGRTLGAVKALQHRAMAALAKALVADRQ